VWTQQEAIPLDGAQGKQIQLRFAFETVDELFNGFRGWLIDDVVVQAAPGTFPPFDPTLQEPPPADGPFLLQSRTGRGR
jgi:hypothetical protein